MYRFIAAVLAASSCAAFAQAQSSPPATAGGALSLEDALSQAGAASPSNDVASAGVRAAEAYRTIAGLRPNPELSVETENVTGTGPYISGLAVAGMPLGSPFMEMPGMKAQRYDVVAFGPSGRRVFARH